MRNPEIAERQMRDFPGHAPRLHGVLRTLADPAGPLALAAAALLALALAHYVYSTDFMRGLTQFWGRQDNDIAQYLSGFNAFVREPWHWPLLRLESINAPQGTIATFLDTIPLYAMLLKLWQHGADMPFRNPYAHWITLCYLLQGVGAWWICRETQLRSWLALAVLTLLLAAFPPLSFRINHISLMSQWLLLFGLACYLRSDRLGKLASAAWMLLMLTAFYINIYLFCMLGLLFATDLLRHAHAGAPLRSIVTAALTGMLLLLSMFITMLPLNGDASGGDWGFGFYSMNMLGPFTGGSLLKFPHPIAHEGQGEGFAYVGIFVLLVAAWGVRLRQRADPHFWQRHRILALTLALMTAFALSNMVYLGQTELFHLDLPAWTSRITGTLRSSGRFFWAVGYTVTAFAVVSVVRFMSPRAAGVLLLSLLAVHGWDLTQHHTYVRETVNAAAVERLHEPLWDGFLGADTRALQVYPPFGCDKGPAPETQLPTMLYAVRHKLSTSTGYLARVKKPCDNYTTEINAIRNPSTAFVFMRADFPQRQQVELLLGGTAAASCIEANFAWLCKRTPAVVMEKTP